MSDDQRERDALADRFADLVWQYVNTEAGRVRLLYKLRELEIDLASVTTDQLAEAAYIIGQGQEARQFLADMAVLDKRMKDLEDLESDG